MRELCLNTAAAVNEQPGDRPSEKASASGTLETGRGRTVDRSTE
jgi:hypothetical protein